ncbi:MAG TPA: hypothetical protein VEH07_02525 [Alphaproteobacteria bacterium]|nr:hypothetical protein [Alphaproteobacteria bacterium]
MRGFLRLLGSLLVIGIFVVPVVLIALTLQRYPLVPENPPILFQDIEDAKALKERYDPRHMSPDVTTRVSADEAQLNTALSAALKAFPRVKGQISVDQSSVEVDGTIELPIPQAPFGRYLNLRIGFLPSSKGLDVESASVGRLPIPAGLVKPAAVFLIDQVVGPGKGAQMLQSIKSLSISGKTVTIAFRPPPTLVQDIKYAAKQAIEVAGMGTIRVYYRKLVDLGQGFGTRKVSLAEFMGPSFELARSRSAFGNPVEENRALILALAIYFGDEHFERLLGEVKAGGLEGVEPDISHVYVQNRNDWVQHFITSAGLTVAGGTAFANELGEAKEVSDTQGDEGFSFGDLAADRTGVRLGVIAAASDESARKVQRALAGHPSESVFFPPISDLPDYVTEEEFKRIYGDVNTAAYRNEVEEIDRRIARIPLYK